MISTCVKIATKGRKIIQLKRQYYTEFLIIPCFNFLILLGAMLSALQLRFLIPFGQRIDPNRYDEAYVATAIIIFSAILGSQLIVSISSRLFSSNWLAPQHQFRTLIIAASLASFVILMALPDISQLQVVYFFCGSLCLGVLVIVFPGRLRHSAYYQANTVPQDLINLYKARSSILIWLKYRIVARYTQAVLGLAWVMLQPLLMSLVISFAFTYLLGARSGPIPWVLILFSGLTVFDIFRSVVNKSTRTLNSSGGLIKQVYFPRETLIVLDVGEAIFDSFFSFLVLVGLGIFYGIYPNIYYLFIPIPLFFLVCLTSGLAFFLSWIGLLVRDLQQLVGVILQLLFYITVLYQGQVSGRFGFLLTLLNPLIGPVQVFRDIVIYARMPDFTALFFSGTLSVALLYVGYVYFKVHEDRFADYV